MWLLPPRLERWGRKAWEGGAQAGLELKADPPELAWAGAPEGPVRGGEEMRLRNQVLPVQRTWARPSAVLSSGVTLARGFPFLSSVSASPRGQLCHPPTEGIYQEARGALVLGTRGKALGLTVYSYLCIVFLKEGPQDCKTPTPTPQNLDLPRPTHTAVARLGEKTGNLCLKTEAPRASVPGTNSAPWAVGRLSRES